jgi:hypothetical protein
MYDDFMIVKQKGFPAYCVIRDKDNCVVYPYVDRKTYLKGRWNDKVKDWVVYQLVEVFYHDNDCYHLWRDEYGVCMCSLYETHKEYLKWSRRHEKWARKHPPTKTFAANPLGVEDDKDK